MKRREKKDNRIEELSKLLQEKSFALEKQIQDQGVEKNRIENRIQEARQEIYQIVHSISHESRKVLESGNRELRQRFNKTPDEYQEDFYDLFGKCFKKVKEGALENLSEEISRRKDHAVALYPGEFQGALEYDLDCLYQLYCSDWKTYILFWRLDYAARRDWEIYFETSGRDKEKLVSMMKKEHSQVGNDTSKEMFKALTEGIYSGFLFEQQQINKKNGSTWNFVPTLDKIVEECKSKAPLTFDPLHFIEIGAKNDKNIEDELKVIKCHFNDILGKIDGLIQQKSMKEAPAYVLAFCLEKTDERKNRGAPIIKTNFVYYLLLKASYKLYKKAEEDICKNYEIIGRKLDQNIQGVNESCDLGRSFIERKAVDIQKMIISDIKVLMAKAVEKRITTESLIERLDQKAYEKSFEARNYRNVVKYVVDTGKFKKEVYFEEIRSYIESEFENEEYLSKNNLFLILVASFQAVLTKWNEDVKDETDVKLATLRPFINFYPELASSLKNIDERTIPIRSVFALTAIDNLHRFMKDWEQDENSRKKTIRQEVFEQFKSSYPNLFECPEKCPRCLSRCTKTDQGHQEHSVQYHILPAFRGFKHPKSKNNALFNCCFSQENHPPGFSGKRLSHKNLMKNFSAWKANLPVREEYKAGSLPVSDAMKDCWVATKDIFLSLHRNADETLPAWLERIPAMRRLSANTIIEGYDILSLKREDSKN